MTEDRAADTLEAGHTGGTPIGDMPNQPASCVAGGVRRFLWKRGRLPAGERRYRHKAPRAIISPGHAIRQPLPD